jgi:NADH:ubiquinone oxidoreductase subunit 6 (subunit J)
VLAALVRSARRPRSRRARPAGGTRPGAGSGRAARPGSARKGTPRTPTTRPETDKKSGFANSRLAALFFWIFAGLTIGGSLFVITRRNLISAVMGMVGTFFALAGLYAMLYAHFLAAIQVLVYAGAIMVLFVFVVMILNRPEDEPWACRDCSARRWPAWPSPTLVARLSGVLWGSRTSRTQKWPGPARRRSRWW